MKKEANLERFEAQIRPYQNYLTGEIGYAVVIPFDNKEDCLNFVRSVNLTIAGIDDEVPPEAVVGQIGEDTVRYVANKLKGNIDPEALKDHDI